jgi:hypothetical protein
MPATVSEKLNAIIHQIDRAGNADLTRLTVLKRWFECPGRLAAFALWIASHAASRGGEATGPALGLFREAHALLSGQGARSAPNRTAAEDLHRRLREFQGTYQRLKWGSARIVQQRDLLLVEEGLAVYLRHPHSPPHGYKLAVAYCEHYDPRYGNGLSGPSVTKLKEIRDFIKCQEARESERARTASSEP